tara:strand:- start:132 stop:668 length:537 start_codon:yes stop_codon:yes gene_type:complete
LIILFGSPKSEVTYTRQTTKRDLAAEAGAQGKEMVPTSVHGWMEKFSGYTGPIGGSPGLLGGIFIDLMVMLTCTARSILSGNGIPEFCYDNTIADININGGKSSGINAEIDMYSWSGLLGALGINFGYNGMTNSLIYWIEMAMFIGWYGFASDMTAGSAVFFFNGFDFIAGRYFWGLV